jgi:hypothetical protein
MKARDIGAIGAIYQPGLAPAVSQEPEIQMWFNNLGRQGTQAPGYFRGDGEGPRCRAFLFDLGRRAASPTSA